MDPADPFPTENRRRHPRRSVSQWSVLGAANEGPEHRSSVRVFRARITDVSRGGMRIVTDEELRPGHPYWFRVEGPRDDQNFRLRGQVAWIREPAVGRLEGCAGVAFLALDESLARDLERTVGGR